jgi:hypothetical protein
MKLKILVNDYLSGATLTAYTDNKLKLKFNPKPKQAEPAAAAASETPAPTDATANLLATRYGRRPPVAVAPVQAAPKPAAPAGPLVDVSKYAGDFTWKRYGDKYQVSGKGLGGGAETVEAGFSDNGRLVIPVPELKLSLFFVRSI